MVTDRTLPADTAPSSGQNTAFAAVQELVETFHAKKSHYLSANYQEAEVRRDFIDKLFVAFGWDVNHDTQRNPYEQEVKVERSVSAGGQRRADYAFHLAPNFRDPRFFVEAKKPYGDIATAENYFQTIRYGWNSGTALAVLTDFEQFHVIDCRYKPDLETALHRAVAKFHYSDYADPDKFARIYWLFSREAVAAGSLEKRAAELPKLSRKARQRGFLPARTSRWTNHSSKTWMSIARNWPALSRLPIPIWIARRSPRLPNARSTDSYSFVSWKTSRSNNSRR